MSEGGVPSVDQLSVLLTVVDAGGFAAAARRLGRAPSAISYSISSLEAQLGVPVFDRTRPRKPVLTEAGQLLLAKATAVIGEVNNFKAAVIGLRHGLEPQLSIAIDVMLHTDRVADVLKAFAEEFPTVALRLYVEALGVIGELVAAGVAGLGICGTLHTNTYGMERIDLGGIDMIPVATPSHPLTRSGIKTPGDVRRHRQLILTVRSSYDEGGRFGVFGVNNWRLADLGAKHALLLAGLGWGNMPEPLVRSDIEEGRLVRLDIPEGGGFYPLQAIYKTATPPGPAGRWLLERFLQQHRTD
ncbi:LysR family transcriptional regulator [Mesorhizobium kowhaii]|uniref:LysR family transcriptional regulator n=1 Tax=Mesorhizobium kowhaii TaxID=1300272 RepID=A0A2W7C6L0_9HYPH|nr:LysR family transcriptional regulator [Mesorhizobium kowhaii]PZV38805.1 LysR family transcriptional regulator [Mesorhizobium kowhaii]